MVSNSVKYILIYWYICAIILSMGIICTTIIKCYFWFRGMIYAGGKDNYGVTYEAAVY